MRLELSRRTDLAIRAIRELSARAARLKGTEMAAAIGTTPHVVAQVMRPLVEAGWVRSEPGRLGGYELLVDPAAVSVRAVIERQEGFPAEGRCVLRNGMCGPERCALHDAWAAARTALEHTLEHTPVTTDGRKQE